MTTNKTQATSADVTAFIAGVADDGQRADAHALCAMMTRLSGEPPKMWGSSIIGFGSYHYKYDSGREGDTLRIGFSPRKGQTVLYLIDDYTGKEAQLARLGKHKTGKSCLYVKRLSDIDIDVLEEMLVGSLAYMAEKYPD
jgi:predicted TPR repeat methyltransferase